MIEVAYNIIIFELESDLKLQLGIVEFEIIVTRNFNVEVDSKNWA